MRHFIEHEKINMNPKYIHLRCDICGKGYPDTVLNVLGWLYFGKLNKGKLQCLDKKLCRRNQRKKL